MFRSAIWCTTIRSAAALLLLAGLGLKDSCAANGTDIDVAQLPVEALPATRLTVTGGDGEMTLVRTPPGFLPCEYPDSTVSVGIVHPRPNPYSGRQAMFYVSASVDLSIDMFRDDGSSIASFDFTRVPPGHYSVEVHGFKSLGVVTFGLRVGDKGFNFRERYKVVD